jgi:hypothetical protein
VSSRLPLELVSDTESASARSSSCCCGVEVAEVCMELRPPQPRRDLGDVLRVGDRGMARLAIPTRERHIYGVLDGEDEASCSPGRGRRAAHAYIDVHFLIN